MANNFVLGYTVLALTGPIMGPKLVGARTVHPRKEILVASRGGAPPVIGTNMFDMAIRATLDQMEENREYLLTKEIYESILADVGRRGWYWDPQWTRANVGFTKAGSKLVVRLVGQKSEVETGLPSGPSAFAFSFSLTFAFSFTLTFAFAFADGHLEGLPQLSKDLEAVRPTLKDGRETHGPVQASVRPGFLAFSGLSEDAVAQILAIAERDGLAHK